MSLPNQIIKPSHADLRSASDLLKSFVRINTSNPPGNELELVELLSWHASSEGFTPLVEGLDPNRPNLVLQLKAEPEHKKFRPLVLSCHLDTVPVSDADEWTHPPFSGAEEDGCIWGRGTIDIKGFAAMAFTAMTLLKKSHLPINRDVIFAAVAGEESGTELGSEWLVNNRAEWLGGNPEYVINELGGFTVHRKGRRFYPIQVAEKGVAWIQMTATGTPGHSSLPSSEGAISKLIEAAHRISKAQLPWHPSPQARAMLSGFAAPEGDFAKKIANLLTNSFVGPGILPLLISDKNQRAATEAILRNTATPTQFSTAEVINALPAEASVNIDGRLAPGQSAESLIRELAKVIGSQLRKHVRFEVLKDSPAVSFATDTELYAAIEDTISDRDEGASVVPSIIPGFTDSQNYAKLGADCYGCYPLQLPESLEFSSLFHGRDERIPILGFNWGLTTLMQLLSEFLCDSPDPEEI